MYYYQKSPKFIKLIFKLNVRKSSVAKFQRQDCLQHINEPIEKSIAQNRDHNRLKCPPKFRKHFMKAALPHINNDLFGNTAMT